MTFINLDALIQAARPENSLERFALGKHLQKIGKQLCADSEQETQTLLELSGATNVDTMYGKLIKSVRRTYSFDDVRHKDLSDRKEALDQDLKALKKSITDVEKRLKDEGNAEVVSENIVLSLK